METTQFTTVFTGTFLVLSSLFLLICHWKLFEKAGKPGWAVLIPVYNLMVLIEIAGKPKWWILLLLIPFVNIVAYVLIIDGISRGFGKDMGFTIALVCLGIYFPAYVGLWGCRLPGTRKRTRRTEQTGAPLRYPLNKFKA